MRKEITLSDGTILKLGKRQVQALDALLNLRASQQVWDVKFQHRYVGFMRRHEVIKSLANHGLASPTDEGILTMQGGEFVWSYALTERGVEAAKLLWKEKACTQ